MHIFPKNRHSYKKRNMYFKKFYFGILLFCLAVHSRNFGQEFYEKERLKKIDSTLNQYKEKDKYKFLNLLPRVNYDVLNSSFSISFSLIGLSNYYQQKKRNKIQLAQLEVSLKDKLANDLEKLNLKIEAFDVDYIVLKNNIDLFKIDFDLFQISKGKYKNNEITTEEFLKLKKAFLHKKNSLKTSLLKLKLKAKAISLKIKSDSLTKSLNILSNSINNYE
jgi:hypothetical protein